MSTVPELDLHLTKATFCSRRGLLKPPSCLMENDGPCVLLPPLSLFPRVPSILSILVPPAGVLGAPVGDSAGSRCCVPPLCGLQEHRPGRDPGTTHLHRLLHHLCSSTHHSRSHCLLATKSPLRLPGWYISNHFKPSMNSVRSLYHIEPRSPRSSATLSCWSWAGRGGSGTILRRLA